MGIALSVRVGSVVLLMGAVVACGGGGSGDDDGDGDPDGGNGDGGGGGGCSTDGVCAADACGTVYRSGCAPVDCGLCRYDGADVDPMGKSPSLAGGATPRVAYIRDGGTPEVRVATFGGVSWSSEPVTTLTASGTNDLSTSIAIASDGAIWVTWTESDDTVNVATRPAAASTWTVERAIGSGVRPAIGVLASGAPVVAFAGISPSGIQLRTKNGGAWSPSTASPDGAFALAMAVSGDQIHLAWRNQADDVRYAGGAIGALVAEAVEVDVPDVPVDVDVAIAVSADGTPHVGYSYAVSEFGYATKAGGSWQKRRFGRWFGQGGGAALAVDSAGASLGRVHVAYLDAFALRLADIDGNVAEQIVSNRCDTGQVTLGFDGAGALHVVHGCENTRGIVWRARRGDRFADGWGASCDAIAQRLYETACSCAPDPARPKCCIVIPSDNGSRNVCSSGLSVAEIARAQLCGDPTVSPSILDACTPAADAAVCTVDGDEGMVTVPPVCLP
ncbi:MAG TPA: hypothetical protein VM261_02745 [Kofleriaceae bacterium]|nr:hypothetical protein [Kofleriaceae bacterium]